MCSLKTWHFWESYGQPLKIKCQPRSNESFNWLSHTYQLGTYQKSFAFIPDKQSNRLGGRKNAVGVTVAIWSFVDGMCEIPLSAQFNMTRHCTVSRIKRKWNATTKKRMKSWRRRSWMSSWSRRPWGRPRSGKPGSMTSHHRKLSISTHWRRRAVSIAMSSHIM